MSRWWPSLGTILWIAFFLALSCGAGRVAMVSADGDPAWHWAHGNWMWEHRAVLRADEFTHTRAGAPVIEMWWLSELAMAAAGNTLGWQGIVVLASAVIATTLWWLYRQMVGEGISAAVALGTVLLAAAVCATHWLARPHLATHLLVVIVGGLLAQGRRLWILPGLMMLWVNLHSMFFTGLIVMGIYAVGNFRRPKYAVLAGLGLAATLVNPNGWHLHAHIAGFLGNDFLVRFAQECAPPDLFSGESIGLWLMLTALAVVLWKARRQVTVTEWLLVAVWLVLGLRMRRNLPLFALVAAPILARHAHAWLAGRIRNLDHLNTGGGQIWAVAAVAGVILLRVPTEPAPDRYPVEAIKFLRSQPMAGEMFNTLDWGGYLMLQLPERRVFIYSRLDDESLIRDFNEIDDAGPLWESVCRKYNVGWTILPRAHRLNQLLAQQPGWRFVRDDGVTTIYCRRPL
jgi:hypothetical protein